MSKLLVFRFSAMGDVIMILPVLKGVLNANKNVEIYLVTQSTFFPFFQGIDRLHTVAIDLKSKHRSFNGLISLYRNIQKEIKPDIVIDLHCVLRSFFLGFLFAVNGREVFRFKKGTLQKLALVRSKKIKNLKTTIDRYADAFRINGYPVDLPGVPVFENNTSIDFNSDIFKNPITIGIAPFAKHPQKIWGIDKIDSLIAKINDTFQVNILLFGAGNVEIDLLAKLESKYPNCIISARHFKLSDEISLMKNLSLMISMDSANMHLAAMAGIPTISIWGATHPAFGFVPYNQPEENIIQYPLAELKCRPCSVYGNKKCIYSDDIRCMRLITVDSVFDRVSQILKANSIRIDT